jgi:hypothetical protein
VHGFSTGEVPEIVILSFWPTKQPKMQKGAVRQFVRQSILQVGYAGYQSIYVMHTGGYVYHTYDREKVVSHFGP